MRRLLQFASNRRALPLVITLVAGGLFKISAFGREAFITSHFGLTPLTDTYFSLQLLPLTLTTYMFGAFGRAFTPAYTNSLNENGNAGWLPGLLVYATLISLMLTALTLAFAPAILGVISAPSDHGNFEILAILGASYVPIVFIGICSGILLTHGRSLGSMILTGLPYLLMTVSLFSISSWSVPGDFSLPVSMTIGFALMGVYGIWWVLTREKPFRDGANLFRPWQFDHFRGFIRQLAASSIETFAYSASQFTMLYFLARSGTGAISANNCATRIGMLGFSLLAQPLTLFMQAQLCTHQDKERKKMIGTFLLGTAACTCLLAVGLFLFRVPVIQLVYMRGKFSQTALQQVAEMLPAWLGYFVVLSMNAVASRYMFTVGRGSAYARHMLFGYAFTNCLRLVVAGRLPVTWIVWCAVIGEGTAFFANLRSCVIEGHFRLPKIATPDPESASAC